MTFFAFLASHDGDAVRLPDPVAEDLVNLRQVVAEALPVLVHGAILTDEAAEPGARRVEVLEVVPGVAGRAEGPVAQIAQPSAVGKLQHDGAPCRGGRGEDEETDQAGYHDR